MTEVVAALIWDKDKFMICQRPAHKARGLLWEFVGGKVEPGEAKDLTVHLTLFNAAILEGIPKKLEHNDIKWITLSEISNYEFCPADVEILKKITEVFRDD